MGGKDDDRGNDLDKWIESQRAEIIKLRDELLGKRNDIEDFRHKSEDPSPSVKGPFERFKTFIDGNLSTLSEGFRNFPSNISELKDRMQQERDARMAEEKDIWRRWTGSEDSPDHIRMQVERLTFEEREASRDAVLMLLRLAYDKNKNVPAHKIEDLYRDNEWRFGGLDRFANPMLSFGGACYYKPETVENLPSTARWGWPASSPRWLSVDWFKRSPYSPIRLEAHPGLEDEGSKWRAAFEDLLSAALDKPMVSEEKVGLRPLGKPQSTYYGPGLEWMLSLQCRGVLPPQLPGVYKTTSLFDGFDGERSRIASYTHNIIEVLESKAAPKDPAIRKDIEALIDEVSIKSGPQTEAAPLRISNAVTSWRVPVTEQELYDEMPPFVEPEEDYSSQMPSVETYHEIKQALCQALQFSDVERAADILTEYYELFDRVGELVGDAVDEVTDTMDSWAQYVIRESLRRSDIPDAEQKKVTSLLVTPWDDLIAKFGPFEVLESPKRPNEKAEEYIKTLEGLEQNLKQKLSQSPKEPVPPQRPDVLAQLTTTQTTRLPDGTVTTKVVLKQRFADGSEEERETVETTHGPSVESAAKNTEESKSEQNDKKKSGWFWS